MAASLFDLHTGPLPELGLRLLSIPLRVVPYALQRGVLEVVLNEVFIRQRTDGDLDDLEGRSLSIWIEDVGCRWRFGFENERIVALVLEEEADVVISGGVREFLQTHHSECGSGYAVFSTPPEY